MYKEIKTQSYYGPADQQNNVKVVLKALGVPNHSAEVSEYTHNTGYCALTTTFTFVEVSLQDAGLQKIVNDALRNIGFSKRKD